MATNYQIISEEANLHGYEYDGTNLKTFSEWKKAGYSVKKGEKAFIKVGLWKPVTVKEKDEKTGEEKEVRQFIMKTSFLFKPDQVQPLKEPKKKKEDKKETVKAEPKKTTKKATVKKPSPTKKATKPKATKKIEAKANQIDDETKEIIMAAFDELGI